MLFVSFRFSIVPKYVFCIHYVVSESYYTGVHPIYHLHTLSVQIEVGDAAIAQGIAQGVAQGGAGDAPGAEEARAW